MKQKILICDDHEAILDVTRLILEQAGYEVATLKTCDNIEEQVLQEGPALILMDLRIPEIGGEEATRRLKKHDDLKQIPVIIFSANHNGDVLAEDAGADDFITKPFEINDLLSMVQRHLQ